MKLEQSFDVDAPLERVWQALIEVEQVAPCLPGAAVTGRNDDGSYNGSFTVKIGPTTASYAGKLEMQDVDESAHTATMHAHGSDKRGQGGATATILSTLSPTDGDRTHVEVVTDYHITGRLARFGRGGMIEDISNKLLRQFADRLQKSLVEEPSGAVAGAEAGAAGAPADAAEAGAQASASAGDAKAGAGASSATGEAGAAGDAGAPAGKAAATGAEATTGAETSAGAGEPTVGAAEGGGVEWTPGGPQGPLAEAEPPPGDAARPPGPSAGPPPGGPGGAEAPAAGPPPAGATGAAPPPPPPPPPPEPPEPIEGLSLMGSVLWGQVKRNPAAIAAFVLGLLVAVALVRRGRR